MSNFSNYVCDDKLQGRRPLLAGGLKYILVQSAINPGFTVGDAGLCLTGEDTNVACGA